MANSMASSMASLTVTLKHLMYCKHYKGGLNAALSSTVKLVSSADPLPACGYFAAKMSDGIYCLLYTSDAADE